MSIRGICKQFYWKVIGFGIIAFLEELGSIHSVVIFSNYYNFLCELAWLFLYWRLIPCLWITNSDEKFNIHKEKSKTGLLSYHK